MSAHKPLEGVKVVELASFVAAPTAGRMMAEMGADVIRVESTAGDPWRFYGANCGLPITDEENPLFDIYNLGKKDIQLNTKTPEGKEILFHLLDEADVFITNNRLKSLVRSGLDYESLKDRFPKLIYGLVTGYGQTGPECPWTHLPVICCGLFLKIRNVGRYGRTQRLSCKRPGLYRRWSYRSCAFWRYLCSAF